MPGLVPGIHAYPHFAFIEQHRVDGRAMPGHDDDPLRFPLEARGWEAALKARRVRGCGAGCHYRLPYPAAQGQEAKHARSKQGERTRLGNMVGRNRDEAQEIAGQSASGFGSSCGGGEDESGKAEEIGGEQRQRGGFGHGRYQIERDITVARIGASSQNRI
jgi:hypothetical protein